MFGIGINNLAFMKIALAIGDVNHVALAKT
jgi:hypothetical protein